MNLTRSNSSSGVPPVGFVSSASRTETPLGTGRPMRTGRSQNGQQRRPATAATVVTAPVDLSRFGNRHSFLTRPFETKQDLLPGASKAELESTRIAALPVAGTAASGMRGSESFQVVRPGSALSTTTRDINASVSDVWGVLRSSESEKVYTSETYAASIELSGEKNKGQAPARTVQRRVSSAASWQRLSRPSRSQLADVSSSHFVMPLERVRQLQSDSEACKAFMKGVKLSQEDARRKAQEKMLAQAPTPIKSPEPAMSLSGDATFSALSAAAAFFERATAVRQLAEKRARRDGVHARREQSLCTKLIRTVEDLERPNEVLTLRAKLTELEILRNSWSVMTVIALFSAETHMRFQRDLWHSGSLRAAQLSSCSASFALRSICSKRLQWELRHCAKFLWKVWTLYRPKVRRMRKSRSADLIQKFLAAVKSSTHVVVAISHFMKTVRNVQSHIRSGRCMREIRVSLAHQQAIRGILLSQSADTARIGILTQQFQQKEAEILGRKTGTRVTKSIKIAELRAEVDYELSRLHRRSNKTSVDLLQKNQNVLLAIVDAALKKRLEDYSKQLGRYAKAVVRYIENMDDLRQRGLVPLRAKRTKTSAVEAELARSVRPREATMNVKKMGHPRESTIVIPQPPVRPFFHSLFSFEEIQSFIDDALDELGVS
jgi:hypothetical protein